MTLKRCGTLALCLCLSMLLLSGCRREKNREKPPAAMQTAATQSAETPPAATATPEPTPAPEPTISPEAVAALSAAGLETPRLRTREECMERLGELSAYDSRFLLVAGREMEYPDVLMVNIANNPDLLEYMLMYPGDTETVSAFTQQEISGETLLLRQYDTRWGYFQYGSSQMAATGCGPTCMSMCALHLAGNTQATPDVVAEAALEKDYYVYGSGTKWLFFTEGAAEFGLKGQELPLWSKSMTDALDAGSWIVCCMKSGDFTVSGHFIVLYGYDESGFWVLDPMSPSRSQITWSYERLEGQISNLWALSAVK